VGKGNGLFFTIQRKIFNETILLFNFDTNELVLLIKIRNSYLIKLPPSLKLHNVTSGPLVFEA